MVQNFFLGLLLNIFRMLLAKKKKINSEGSTALWGGHHPHLPPMDMYGVVSISLWWANFFLGSSLTLKVENAFFSALYYSIITTVLWKKGRGQDSYFSSKSDEKINGLWKAQLDTSTFLCQNKRRSNVMIWYVLILTIFLSFFFIIVIAGLASCSSIPNVNFAWE